MLTVDELFKNLPLPTLASYEESSEREPPPAATLAAQRKVLAFPPRAELSFAAVREGAPKW